MTRTAAGIASVVACLLLTTGARAEYPDRPVKVVIGLPAGGGADIMTRWYVDKLREISGGTFFVENKVGAASNIAIDHVAKSKPDGYTLMFGASASMAGNRYLYKNLPYDSVRDIDPITTFCQLGFALVVNPEKTPVNSVAELTAFLKAKNGKATYGWAVTSAIASSVLYITSAKIEAVQVGYKTTAASVSDVIAGQIDFAFADMVYATGLAKQGKIKILANSADKRALSAPDIPTMAEAGLPDATQTPWWAVWGPHGLPPEIIEKTGKWVNQITAMPETVQFLTTQGADPLPGSADATRKKLLESIKIWERVVSIAKIEPQ